MRWREMMDTRYVNLTPHPITLIGADGSRTTIKPDPSGPARVASRAGSEIRLKPMLWCHDCGASYDLGQLCCPECGSEYCSDTHEQQPALLFSAPTWGEVEGLPEPQEDTIYIVSALVAERSSGRTDMYSPGTGPQDGAIRDERGRVEAVTRLIQAPRQADKPVIQSASELEAFAEQYSYEVRCDIEADAAIRGFAREVASKWGLRQ